jgi:regulator of cell morphogenesis and NO signaling
MYQNKKLYVKSDMKMSDLIFENPVILLMLDHFGLDYTVQGKSVGQFTGENGISQEVFLTIANLYNGYVLPYEANYTINDITSLLKYLRNCHIYYQNDKYPEIKDYISQLYDKNDASEIKLVEKFFNEYYEEVKEHLDYEEQIAFPYFCELVEMESDKNLIGKSKFSVNNYTEHHSDIESKLTDLKNLLIKHISLKGNHVLRRKLLNSLSELEFDLKIHSMIEEMILIPLVERIESAKKNG